MESLDTSGSNFLMPVRQGSISPYPSPLPFGLDDDQKPVGCSRRREGMLKLSNWLLHFKGEMMMMMMVLYNDANLQKGCCMMIK